MKLIHALILALLAALPARAEVDIQDVTSPDGLNAWLVEDHSIPFVALEIRFRGGTSIDPDGKRGAVNLMMALLEEGTGDMDARDFARARDALAASFSYSAQRDSVSVSARFLSENRDEAMALLRQSIIAPSFPEDAVERVREQVFSGLRSDAKDPNTIANQKMDALAFPGHPYGTSGDGTMDSVAGLSRDDMIAVHQGAMARDRIVIGAVGDISAEDLGPMLDMLLEGLPDTGLPLPTRTDYALTGGTTVVSFDTPQSVAVWSQPGIERHDDDFFAAYVLNMVLGGGGFESRLMHEVREKRGLTYGVSSYLVSRDYGDMIWGQVASANDRVAETMDVIRSEWARIADQGVTEQELRDAQTYLTGAYPLRFDGNGPIASILVGMQMDDLGVDYILTRNDKVNAVTLDDVNRVARELLDANALHFVVVGQPEGL